MIIIPKSTVYKNEFESHLEAVWLDTAASDGRANRKDWGSMSTKIGVQPRCSQSVNSLLFSWMKTMPTCKGCLVNIKITEWFTSQEQYQSNTSQLPCRLNPCYLHGVCLVRYSRSIWGFECQKMLSQCGVGMFNGINYHLYIDLLLLKAQEAVTHWVAMNCHYC